MQEEILNIQGVKIINNIPHAVGVGAVQRVFEYYGIKKSKKATYKFTSKVGWKKRFRTNGKSLIAVPIPEIERWIEKNYPIVWSSKMGNDEKRLIAKNFSVVGGFEKIINEIEHRLNGGVENSPTNDSYLPSIWKIEEENISGSGREQEKNILSKIGEIIDILVDTPPSSLDDDTLSKIKGKLLCLLNFIDSICSINRLKEE